jgi:hypothetical protein
MYGRSLFTGGAITMKPLHSYITGKGTGNRQSHVPPVTGPGLITQTDEARYPHYPFQPLPTPLGPPPFRYDLSQLLSPADIEQITTDGVLVCHAVGDTGDYRGQQKNFVAQLMTQDAATSHPACVYKKGVVIYLAGDIYK